jgi:hypothetical protein
MERGSCWDWPERSKTERTLRAAWWNRSFRLAFLVLSFKRGSRGTGQELVWLKLAGVAGAAISSAAVASVGAPWYGCSQVV